VTCGVAAIASVIGRAQDGAALPQEGGRATLVGCFVHQAVTEQHGVLRWSKTHDKYMLASPRMGPATTVPEAECSASGTEEMLHLDGVHKSGLDQATPGRWIEISGKLNKAPHGTDLREFHVKAFHEVPVAPPAVAAAPAPQPYIAPAPMPRAEAAPAPAPPAEKPVATTGTKKIPHTASPLPLTALSGLLAIALGLALQQFARRRTLGRG
jgi:hypothetical protein